MLPEPAGSPATPLAADPLTPDNLSTLRAGALVCGNQKDLSSDDELGGVDDE